MSQLLVHSAGVKGICLPGITFCNLSYLIILEQGCQMQTEVWGLQLCYLCLGLLHWILTQGQEYSTIAQVFSVMKQSRKCRYIWGPWIRAFAVFHKYLKKERTGKVFVPGLAIEIKTSFSHLGAHGAVFHFFPQSFAQQCSTLLFLKYTFPEVPAASPSVSAIHCGGFVVQPARGSPHLSSRSPAPRPRPWRLRSTRTLTWFTQECI